MTETDPPCLTRLRALALALPDASERQSWGDPTFRVKDKVFAMVKSMADRPSVWLKAPEGAADLLIEAAPDRIFRPPYVGHKGWVGLRLDASPDWAAVENSVRQSFRLIAPGKLAALIE